MPSYEFEMEDFFELIGKRYSVEELDDRLGMIGAPLEKQETEGYLKVELSPNRPDMLSVEGLARTFKGFMGLETGLPDLLPGVKPSDYRLIVDPSVKNVRPHIVCAVIKNINFNDESIQAVMQFQEKIHVTHCRGRKKGSIGVYDMTGLEFPLHYKAVDLDGIEFEPLQMPGENWTPREILEKHPKGIEYAHLVDKKAPILLDNKGTVLSFPPIINSENTKLTMDSTDLVIDVTGLDYDIASSSLNMLCANLIDRGAEIYTVTVVQTDDQEVTTPDLSAKTWKIDHEYINKWIGLELSAEGIADLLEKMRFGAKHVGNEIEVQVPAYRVDIMHPVDFAEDVAIAYGYDELEPEIPQISTLAQQKTIELFSRKLTYLFTGLQAFEVISYVLTNREENFNRMNLPEDYEQVAEISNPKTTRYRICRTWLTPSLMEILSRNTDFPYPQRIFEIGDVITIDEEYETGARNVRKACFAEAGLKAGFNSMKGVLGTIGQSLGMEFELEPLDHPSFIPGRLGKVILVTKDGKKIESGLLGEIHPRVINNWNLSMPVSILELYMEILHDYF
ncbi:MAG: phenylalanine--tRNA ligase subunit beta [Candidatus Hodarchaeales archaeon]|jgi:phenylalanyl-tRNA synthetase beta chain